MVSGMASIFILKSVLWGTTDYSALCIYLPVYMFVCVYMCIIFCLGELVALKFFLVIRHVEKKYRYILIFKNLYLKFTACNVQFHCG